MLYGFSISTLALVITTQKCSHVGNLTYLDRLCLAATSTRTSSSSGTAETGLQGRLKKRKFGRLYHALLPVQKKAFQHRFGDKSPRIVGLTYGLSLQQYIVTLKLKLTSNLPLVRLQSHKILPQNVYKISHCGQLLQTTVVVPEQKPLFCMTPQL